MTWWQLALMWVLWTPTTKKAFCRARCRRVLTSSRTIRSPPSHRLKKASFKRASGRVQGAWATKRNRPVRVTLLSRIVLARVIPSPHSGDYSVDKSPWNWKTHPQLEVSHESQVLRPSCFGFYFSLLGFSSHLCAPRRGVVRHIKNDDHEGNRDEYPMGESARGN